jgi:DNA-binding NtrC family response regulator
LSRSLGALFKVAASEISVLLLGEAGTGKELLAASLHGASKRKGRLVTVPCASIQSAEGFANIQVTAVGGTALLKALGDLAA